MGAIQHEDKHLKCDKNVLLALNSCSQIAGAEEGPADPTAPTSAIQIAEVEGPLLFSNTAVGGTFDRLHAGHRILLAATALVTTTMAFVGVTSIPTVSRTKCNDSATYMQISLSEKALHPSCDVAICCRLSC